MQQKEPVIPPFESLRLNTPPRFYRCEPGWRWVPPPLPDYDLWCVLEGEGRMRLEGDTFPLAVGTCFLFPPGARLWGTQNPAKRLCVFATHFEPLDAYGEPITPTLIRLPPPGLTLRDTAFFFSLAQRCERCFQRGDALGERQSRLLVHQMLLHLWEEAFYPNPSPLDARMREILRAIREEPGSPWTVEEQARRAGLSRSQFTRRFQAETGLSPTAFVIRTRLERASHLVRETDMSLGQIASALGYRDVFFFSRQFKRYMGHAPSTLRRGGPGEKQ